MAHGDAYGEVGLGDCMVRQPVSFGAEDERKPVDRMDTFAFIDAHWGPDVPVFVASPDQLRQLTGYRP